MIPVTYSYPWVNPDPEIQKANLKNLAENGIKNLVLQDKNLEEIIRHPELAYQWKEHLAEFGLKFMDAHAPWGLWKDPGMPFEEIHDAIINYHKIAILYCHILGITSITYHTGNTYPSIAQYPGKTFTFDDYKKMLRRAMEELLPYAEKHNVVLALENQWTPLNQSPCILEVLEEFNSPYLGFCYDAGHAHLTECGEKDPERSTVPAFWNMMGLPVYWEKDIVGIFKKWVVNCHFHSNDGWNDQHLLPDPGSDTMPWDHIMDVLADAPRLQCIQSEVKIDDSITPEILRNAFRKISPLLEV